MTAMAGIIVSLVGLGIVIGASVSFVYPLPGLTTNRGRGWTVVVGYGVLCWGSTIIRQTVPEELREPFADPIMLVILGVFVLSCIALIRPSPNLWLSTRKQAGYVCGLSLGLMVVASQLLPEPPPPTSEELAALAAEAKREAEEAEAERRAEERAQGAITQARGDSVCKTDRFTCIERRSACVLRAHDAAASCLSECGDLWIRASNFDTKTCAEPCINTAKEEEDWCKKRYAWKGD
ncbi:MAG: hypothetical protein OXC18_14790 [Desulfurellaceae bacterium]|nr:hypothetical protein [Desulfurellaceae bacterium]